MGSLFIVFAAENGARYLAYEMQEALRYASGAYASRIFSIDLDKKIIFELPHSWVIAQTEALKDLGRVSSRSNKKS